MIHRLSAFLVLSALLGLIAGCGWSPSTESEASAQFDGRSATRVERTAQSPSPSVQPISFDGLADYQVGGRAPPGKSEVVDSEWSMMIEPDATIVILHRGFPVVREAHVSWAEQSKWVESKFKAENVREGQGTIAGEIAGLDLKAQGTIRTLADNELAVEYQFTATRGHDGIKGAVLDWQFELASPTFSGKAADPIFLENQTGWKWQIDRNQAITVRFDQPVDNIIYEANRRNNIRAFYYAGEVKPGTGA